MTKKAIVVGSGFGGIASSLRLKALGYEVTLLEKLEQLGGRARVFKKKGYTFDAGPTVITAPFLFDELFDLFNKKRENYVKFKRLDPMYNFYFNQNKKSFNYFDKVEDSLKEIAKFNPKDVEGYKKILKMSEKIYKVGFDKLSFTPFHNFFFMIRQIPSLIKLKSYLTVFQLVSKYIKNEQIKQALSIQPLLLGGNPLETTSIYNLIHYLERKWGVHYAMGGTGAIIRAFEKLMNEEKIKINKNTDVKEIIFKNNKAIGVKAQNGRELFGEKIILNCDPAYAYKHIIKKKKKWSDKKIDKLDFSMGLFVIYFGTRKKYHKIAHHTIWMGKRYEGLLKDIFNKKILADDFSLYLHRPTATDKSMAPKGHDCFYVLVPVPNNQSNIDWSREGEKFKNLVIEKMEQTLLPNLRENIVEDFYLTPDYFERDLNTKHGSGFSIQPKFSQSAYFRFHNKSEVYDGLYFVGAGTHPGAGVPGVLSSAKVLDKIL